jgi:RNA polymerase sigma factor (sigma-70 family)
VEKKEQIEVIIAGCVQNSRVHQEKLFKLFYGKLMTVCMRYTSDKDTAQEILQEGFIKIFDKIHTYESSGSFEGWLRRIVTNTALDSIRKSKRLNWTEENEINTKEDFFNPLEEIENEDILHMKADHALQAIQKLSPAYRTVFNLYVMEEMTHKQIAEKLGISEGTSKSNYAKAKMNLKKYIANYFTKIENA